MRKQLSFWLSLLSQGPQRHRICGPLDTEYSDTIHFCWGSGLCTAVLKGLSHAIPKFSEGAGSTEQRDF